MAHSGAMKVCSQMRLALARLRKYWRFHGSHMETRRIKFSHIQTYIAYAAM